MVSTPMKLVVLAASVVVALVFFDRHQRLKLAQERELQQRQVAVERESERATLEAERQRRDALARQRAQEDAAARRAAMSPAELRREALQRQFHPWDGSHMAVEERIKASMNDPASYKHVQTRFEDVGPGAGLWVHTTFRGTNALGAVVTNTARAHVNESGAVTAFELGVGSQ